MKRIAAPRPLIASVASLILLVTLVSCSSSESDNTNQSGGSIKVGIFDNFPGFCVGNNPANSALMATRTMYETLFEKTEQGEFVGLLATKATSSDDLKTWTVDLREGVTFHDGTTFDADAVIANFNAITGRIAAAAFAQSGMAGLQAKGYTIGTGTAFTANILDVKKTDTYSIQFVLERAQNDFPATLYASGRFVMRSPAQLEDATSCGQTPIGTGPFKFSSFTPSQLVVTRNVDYWRKDPQTNAQLPYLDKITFDVVLDGAQRSAAVRTGTYDATFFSAATDAQYIQDLRRSTDETTEYQSEREYYPSLWLNQGKPGSPFANKAARQAVLSCLNREGFNTSRLKDEGDVATSIVGETNVMYSTTGFPSYDPTRAKAYVEQYKKETKKKSLEFVFPADTSLSSQANARFFEAMWKNCNITARYTVEQTPLILSKAFNPSPDVSKGQYYNSYDAVFLTLFEGDDAAFNVPFVLSNAYATGSVNPVKPLFQNSLGKVLGLNHHSDTTVDDFFYRGQAAATIDEARDSYQAGTSYLQQNAFMGSLVTHYYSLFTTQNLDGVDSLPLPDGSMQRVVTNWGIDWTGVYKKS
jgi:ABC-type transport system substrate-binding protein